MELAYKKEFGEESAALVYKIDHDYEVYEIPQYGGEPRFEGIFDRTF